MCSTHQDPKTFLERTKWVQVLVNGLDQELEAKQEWKRSEGKKNQISLFLTYFSKSMRTYDTNFTSSGGLSILREC